MSIEKGILPSCTPAECYVWNRWQLALAYIVNCKIYYKSLDFFSNKFRLKGANSRAKRIFDIATGALYYR